MAEPPLRTILIVDDNQEILDVLRFVFELDGFTVVGEATTGLEAVALGLRLQPDYIVLDSEMPARNGHAAAVVVRAVAPETEIIGFSGTMSTPPSWADHFLTKERVAELSPLLGKLVALAV